MTSSLMPLLAFGAVVAMIPVVLWLLKRTPLAGFGGGAAQAPMRVVAMLPLSPSQRLLTVEVGQGEARQWLVLGVTAAGINTLHTMAPQGEAPAPGAAPPAPFAQLLAKVRGDAPGPATGQGPQS